MYSIACFQPDNSGFIPKKQRTLFFFSLFFFGRSSLTPFVPFSQEMRDRMGEECITQRQTKNYVPWFLEIPRATCSTILGIIPCNECQYYKRGKIISQIFFFPVSFSDNRKLCKAFQLYFDLIRQLLICRYFFHRIQKLSFMSPCDSEILQSEQ